MASDTQWALLDIREAGEADAGHVQGATFLPRRMLELRAAELVPDRGTTIVVYDEGGARAGRAAQSLERAGYRDVRVLDGGTAAWQAAGLPLATGSNVPSKLFGEEVYEHQRRAAAPGHRARALAARGQAAPRRRHPHPGRISRGPHPGRVGRLRRRRRAQRGRPRGARRADRGPLRGPHAQHHRVPDAARARRRERRGRRERHDGLDARRLRPRARAVRPPARAVAAKRRGRDRPRGRAGDERRRDARRRRRAPRAGSRRATRASSTCTCSTCGRCPTSRPATCRVRARCPAASRSSAPTSSSPCATRASCSSTSTKVARSITAWWLRTMGFPHVHVLAGGLAAWRAGGGEVERGRPRAVPLRLDEAKRAGRRLAPDALRDALAEAPDAVVVDVGTSRHYADGHLPRARWVPYGWLEDRIPDIAPSRESIVVVTDQAGLHAGYAAENLIALGYPNVWVLDGGVAAWSKAALGRRDRPRRSRADGHRHAAVREGSRDDGALSRVGAAADAAAARRGALNSRCACSPPRARPRELGPAGRHGRVGPGDAEPVTLTRALIAQRHARPASRVRRRDLVRHVGACVRGRHRFPLLLRRGEQPRPRARGCARHPGARTTRRWTRASQRSAACRRPDASARPADEHGRYSLGVAHEYLVPRSRRRAS